MIEFDFRDFERMARGLGALADQIPFALSQALNDAAEATRKDLIESTWPKHVQVRNANFMKAALTTKGERATKKQLRVAIYDRLGRASLPLHAEGGAKRPKGQALAVPSKLVASKRRGTGVPKGLRPRAIPNSFKKGDAIYQRVGPKKRQLKLMYSLRPSAQIRGEVPFEDDFVRSMRERTFRAFGVRMQIAMKTRRGR